MLCERICGTIAAGLAAILIGVVVVLTPTGQARAHGDADWMMTHPDYGWCCGPKDCSTLEA